ncbi:MAG: hypothetical protein HY775_05860 [Acidobacteria bacterium]|nr:hypothetical protein [Acidobacteriota bacterium]
MRTRRKVAVRYSLLTLLGGVLLVPVLAGAGGKALPSQREWMRAHGKDKGVWMSRSGNAKKTLTKRDVKNWAKTAPPGKDCQAGCHKRGSLVEALRATKVKSPGFTNVFGETPSYSGSIYPFALLTNKNNTKKHAEIFKTKGCGGCHSPQAAKDRGVSDIVGCKSCHNFAIFSYDPNRLVASKNVATDGNMHATHGTLLNAVIPLGDASAAPGTNSCNFCHNPGPEGGTGSCWSCHLSGHWPQVPYFKEIPA